MHSGVLNIAVQQPCATLLSVANKQVHIYSVTFLQGEYGGLTFDRTAAVNRAWGTATVLRLLVQENALEKP